jgi:hypothetical protein
MKRQHILKLFLILGVLWEPCVTFAASNIAIFRISPILIRQNDETTITIKGTGFKEGATIDMGSGIKVIATSITSNSISAQVAVDSETKIGFRKVVVTNTDGGRALRLLGLLVFPCKTDCQFKGNVIPFHDANSSAYRTDCTSTACHKGILSETSIDNSTATFHVLKVKKLTVIPGKTEDDKCVYCHKDTDLVEGSAGNLRRNVDVELCVACHTGKFYK